MAHPIFEVNNYPWDRPIADALWKALYTNIVDKTRITLFYQQCGGALDSLNRDVTPRELWRQVLEGLAAVRKLQLLCELVSADGDAIGAHGSARAVIDAPSVLDQFTVVHLGTTLPFVNRRNLRAELEKLSAPKAPVGVLLVRGDAQTGRSWTRHLVEARAVEIGEDPSLYLFDGNAANLTRALRVIFGELNGTTPVVNTTDPAWMDETLMDMKVAAAKRNKRLWIVMDDLGETEGAPKIDPQVRLFFEQFVQHMANPAFAYWFRLVLLEYPKGDFPTRWKKTTLTEDDTDQALPVADDIATFLMQWAQQSKRNVASEHAAQLAGQILEKVQSIPKPGAWQRVHDELKTVLKRL